LIYSDPSNKIGDMWHHACTRSSWIRTLFMDTKICVVTNRKSTKFISSNLQVLIETLSDLGAQVRWVSEFKLPTHFIHLITILLTALL